jgi:hypothetical protein
MTHKPEGHWETCGAQEGGELIASTVRQVRFLGLSSPSQRCLSSGKVGGWLGATWVVSLEERMADSHEAEGAVPFPAIAVVC